MIYKVPIQPLPNVINVGHIRYASGWVNKYHHARNTLFFVNSGKFIYTFPNKRQVTLTAGTHLLVPADIPYKVTATEDCDYYFISFETSEKITEVLEQETADILNIQSEKQRVAHFEPYNCPPDNYVYLSESASHGSAYNKLQYQISRCSNFRYGYSPLDRLRLLNAFHNLLLVLGEETSEQLLDMKHLSPTLLKLIRHIEENYTSPLSLQLLSDRFSLSKQYIMRLFREQFGVTVTHYINEIRLRKSLELLTFHSLSISEVAYAVGFSSIFYFDRLFKNTYSITPSEYQEAHSSIRQSSKSSAPQVQNKS